MYFYIICKFLKIRLKRINESVIRMNSGKQFIKLRSLLSTMNSLYIEINECNTSYWSKFLLNVWLTFGTSIVCLLHTTIFIKMQPTLIFTFLYCVLAFWSMFFFIIFTASSVHLEANNSNKYLNSLFVLNIFRKTKSIQLKYKVLIY